MFIKTPKVSISFLVVESKFGVMTPEFVADGFIKLVTRGVVSNSFHDRMSQHFLGSIGIAPTRDCTNFHTIDAWSPGLGFIPMISTKGIN